MSYDFYFKKSRVWLDSKELSVHIYRLSTNYPEDEKYNLVAQIRRSAISVPSNIAEGLSRKTGKDQARFTMTAYGSLIELLNLILLSENLGIVDKSEIIEIEIRIESIAKQLNALHKTQLKR